MVEFASFSKDEYAIVQRIIKRAQAAFARQGIDYDYLTADMDISAVHATCPLRLEDFANAPEYDFTHDMFGIYRHLNRQTGELEGCFLPRYAQPASATHAE